MANAQTAIHFETLEYKDEGVTCVGTLVHDVAAPGRLPGVLVAPSFMGADNMARRKAMQIARLGYTVLVMDPYGDGRVANDRAEARTLMNGLLADRAVLRRRAQAALKALRYHRRADGSHLAALGYCFGGLVALELARAGAEVRGVVSFHGILDAGGAPPPKEIGPRVLVLHGAEDPHVPEAQCEAFRAEMRAARADWQMVYYGGAVHAFTNPDAGSDPKTGLAYDETADQRSWKLMTSFLEECFADSYGV
ncbi:MAG: dienelactone hydrolase family protein [Elusimicrobia bacterium]|nr:dienelactone hydrolase family protein [Elusimicrobiota bacterium]